MRKRVLFVVPSLAGGGAERVMTTLLRHLDRRQLEPHLGLVAAQGVYLAAVPEDVPVHDLGAGRVRRAILPLVALTRRLRPDVILSTLGHLNVALALARPLLPPCRLVLREASVPGANAEFNRERLIGALYRAYRMADHVICQSNSIASDLQHRFRVRDDRISVIGNPIDLEVVRGMAGEGSLPQPDGRPQLVAAGRLSREKGFDLLLRAFAMVRSVHEGASLWLLGEGPDRTRLEELAHTLSIDGAVRFFGFQQNPYRYFKAADLFVLSSHYEGFPNVLVEALACGTPAAACNAPGAIGDIISPGVNGRLVPPGSADDLAQGILAAIDQFPRTSQLEDRVIDSVRPFALERIVPQYQAALVG